MTADHFVVVGEGDPHDGYVGTWASPSPFPVGWTDGSGQLWWRCYSPRPGQVDDVEDRNGHRCRRVYLFQLVPGHLHPWTFEPEDDDPSVLAGGTSEAAVAFMIDDPAVPDHGTTIWHGGEEPGPFSRPWTDPEGRHWHRCYRTRPGASDIVATDRGPARRVHLFKVVRGALDPWTYQPLSGEEQAAIFGTVSRPSGRSPEASGS